MLPEQKTKRNLYNSCCILDTNYATDIFLNTEDTLENMFDMFLCSSCCYIIMLLKYRVEFITLDRRTFCYECPEVKHSFSENIDCPLSV